MTDTQTTTLADFLLARFAEDEADAQAEVARDLVAHGETDPFYAYRFMDPARVLAECEAKRRIVELLAAGGRDEARAGMDAARERLLPLLALPYADHPDYRPGWRP
jgi:hypothetical protein